MKINLTVITPTFNEEGSILECINRLKIVMKKCCPEINYEHIIIDNCSEDETVNIAVEESKKDPRIKILVNSRNVGGPRSIYKALSRASGEWIIPMLPADLQDPAEVIPLMLEKAVDGVEIVYGVRKNRQERLLIRSLRKIYYRTLRNFSTFNLQNDAGDFVLISSRVAMSINSVQDQNPYVRGMIAQTGARFDSVSYTMNKRMQGESKYSAFMLADVAISGMVSSTYIPARIALIMGFLASILGVIAGSIYLLLTIFSGQDTNSGIPTIIITMFFLGGIQLFFLGLIGEYVLSIHRQVKPEPNVTFINEVNF
jgi:glycosyltransferase involved in cell wall biosynthesis